MTITAAKLRSAIDTGHLESKLFFDGEQIAIRLLIDGATFATVGCSRHERPVAKVMRDEKSVGVFPSPIEREEFMISCESHDEAMLIADALDHCLEVTYLDLVNRDQ